ncbi:hypothetical protein [Roseovarius aestuariivivens]|uniref:hypothetical protein n=1 Tax=Roseovarius aestuariivivens TaxID=1888910 RepID=UPI0010815C56|nr:hypothetical protein [Roseovarius aestuariivivens]
MPRHVLIHPGFHKTGTSTLQRNLQSQSAQLKDRLSVMLTDDVIEATRLARKYSVHTREDVLTAFTNAFADALTRVDLANERPLLLSSEALLGQLPGRKKVSGYDAAAPLLQAAVGVLRNRIGDTVPVTVWFTTRDPEGWKKSAYYQNLRQVRLREDFATHATKLDRASRLDSFVALTRDALAGLAAVTSTRIEDCAAHPLGPMGVALDLLGVEHDNLAPVRPHNVQPQAGAQELLKLNRSNLTDDELAKAKRALIREYRKSGQTNRL